MSMNIIVPNNSYGNTDQFYAVWKLTRAIKAAGWKYLGSSSGVSGDAKEITGSPILDLWGPGGVVGGGIQLGSQTGSVAAIGASPTSKKVTVTGLTGMTTNSVGNALTISGSTNYNGTFTIVEYISSSSVKIYVGNNVNSWGAESSLTWSERISGTASITWSDLVHGREQTISGLSGMTADSAGHYIKLSGSSNSNNNGIFNILSYVSPTSVVIVNNNASAATNTASGSWVELDPLLDVYPGNLTSTTFAIYAWSLFQGPSTLKIPINAASVGTFLKGEIISEDTSNARGELLGYQYEPTLSYGYLVVMPLSDGYSTGVKGWDTAGTVITGAASGATVTTANTHTPIEYVREIEFMMHNSSTTGSILYQCVDKVGESALRFSTLMNSTGCDYDAGPGIGGTANTFPITGSLAAKHQTYWFNYTTTNPYGKFQITVADADYKETNSADGSFTLAVGYGWTNTGAHVGFGFYRCDNSEDGDVDPFVWFMPSSATAYSEGNFVAGVGIPSTYYDHFCSAGQINRSSFKGLRRRGFSSSDEYQCFIAASLCRVGTSQTTLLYPYTAINDVVATSISPTRPKVREPIWVISDQEVQTITGLSFGKMRKGTLRWMFIVQGGSGCDTYDNKQWVQLSSVNGPWVAGPWNGLTDPAST